MRSWSLLLAAWTFAALAAGCAVDPAAPHPSVHTSFDQYQRETVQRLTARRVSLGDAADREVALNAPQEWRPPGRIRGGVLLVHGLGDSPWSFHDLGASLAHQGFLVRSVLLPGHGTAPQDLLSVELEEWQHVVAEQAELLKQEAGLLFLGGFSTGANLVLDRAYKDVDIAGLLLFSPAFRASVPFGWLTPLLRHVRPWLLEPAPGQETLPTRYGNVPTNGFAQYHRSSRLAQRHLRLDGYHRPVFMVLAAGDSVVDTAYAVQTFASRFPHPASRLVWYGPPPAAANGDSRILVRPDALPAWRISQFSHMGVLFSPANPLYGRDGALRLCRNSRDDAATRDCEQGGDVWFSEWGYQEPGKVHARLTFNPYFDWQVQQMASVLDAATEPMAAGEFPAPDGSTPRR